MWWCSVGHGAVIGQGVQGGQLGKAEVQFAELRREANHKVSPDGAAHRDPIRHLARVGKPVTGGFHRTSQKFGGRVDIWMPTYGKAVNFGIQKAQIVILDSNLALK